MRSTIVWFRNDLRLHDNETVTRALEENEEVCFVYIKPKENQNNPTAAIAYPFRHQEQFRLECLHDLQSQLSKRGAVLNYYEGNAPDILMSLCDKHHISTIYMGAEYAHDELKEEAALSQHITLKRYHTSTLVHPQQLPFEISKLPDVFTSFRNNVEKGFQLTPLFRVPEQIQSHQLSLMSTAITPLSSNQTNNKHDIHFKGGRAAALQRIQHYFFDSKCISRYKQTRNGLLGMDYSSKFSPWLSAGCISPREIYAQLLRYEQQYGSNESTYWLKFELLWRDYFRYVMMKYGNRLFYASGIRNISGQYSIDWNLFNKWCIGNTGEPFVDANMRELWHSGFMSNRGRQNVASYLVHDLHIDWRWGAAWFERLLIDYDVYSNYGNWQYVAGVGNDPREGRKFNIKRQQEMYDTEGAYVDYWLK